MKQIAKSIKPVIGIFAMIIMLLAFNACSNDDDSTEIIIEEEEEIVIDDTDFEATDWTTETHSKDADPNFDEVF